jgi:hypothetical protein
VQAAEAAEVRAIDRTDTTLAHAPPARHETLPAALEPELRKIIDTAVAQVAAIELDAIRQSRALTQRSEEEGREALKYALDRAFQVMNSFELLTGTIAGMVDALRVELDDAVEALRNVQEPESELSRELDERRAAQEPPEEPPAVPQEPEPEPQAAAEPEPVAEPSLNGGGAEPLAEASPELTEMFREQIQHMRDSGDSREQAEQSLLRFNVGRRFLGLLDEVYAEDPAETADASGDGQRKRRVRGFFSR